MPADPAARFADLMSTLDHPMAIVTTASGEVRSGCLVGFHGQCGIDPPHYAVWLSKANHSYRIAVLTEVFAVHFPAADDRALAELFGTDTGDDVDKFTRTTWTRGPDDVPLLDDCPTRLIGRRIAWLDAGPDHVCLILEPISVDGSGPSTPDAATRLMFRDVLGLEAGHAPAERQHPT